MSHWDSAKNVVVRFPPEPYPGYPGWVRIDCGCCAGLQWGGEYPIECDSCAGRGEIAYHEKSGVTAHYPGGLFC